MNLEQATTEVPPNNIDTIPEKQSLKEAIDIFKESLKHHSNIDQYTKFIHTYIFNKNSRTTVECQEAILSELRRLYTDKTDKSKHHIINNIWLVIKQLNMLLNESNIEIDKNSLNLCLLGIVLGNLETSL